MHDWKDNTTYVDHRFSNPDKIAYTPQVKTVMNQLSILEGGAREGYVEQQRRMVQATLDVPNQIPSHDLMANYVAIHSLSGDITHGR